MNSIIVLNLLCAIVLASATNTTDLKPDRRAGSEPAPSMVDTFRQEVNQILKFTWEKLQKTSYTVEDYVVLQNFEDFDRKIRSVQDITTRSSNFKSFLPIWSYTMLDAEIDKINKLYENFVVFYRENSMDKEKSRDRWIALAQSLYDPNIGIPNSLQRIQMYLNVKVGSEYLYSSIQQEASSKVCYLKQSPYQILYNLYSLITTTELKAHAMMQFSYVVLTIFNIGDYKKEAQIEMEAYGESTKKRIKDLQDLLSMTDRSVYQCDPVEYAEDVTYTRLKKLLQGYIENERNMHYRGSCLKQCRDYKNTNFTSCNKGFCNNQPKCDGRILRCTLEKPNMTLCLSKDSSRRYDWVDYEGGLVMGKKNICEKENLFKVDSWKRYIVECSYCLCLCEESVEKSDRFFNLRDVTSDVYDNKVVTGVRIIKRRRIIHLQIQQGILTPRGRINKASLSWKPVEEYSLNEANVTKDVDYHVMDYKARSLNLNELTGPVEHAVTGVRFQKMGSRLSLGIRVTPIDFERGRVSTHLDSYWLKNRKNPPRTAEITLSAPDVPTIFTSHFINSTADQFIRFQPTSFKKDLAQTTVPFLDSQETLSDGVPLSGMGLVYRAQTGSGGFIAPKVLTYEFGPHLRYD